MTVEAIREMARRSWYLEKAGGMIVQLKNPFAGWAEFLPWWNKHKQVPIVNVDRNPYALQHPGHLLDAAGMHRLVGDATFDSCHIPLWAAIWALEGGIAADTELHLQYTSAMIVPSINQPVEQSALSPELYAIRFIGEHRLSRQLVLDKLSIKVLCGEQSFLIDLATIIDMQPYHFEGVTDESYVLYPRPRRFSLTSDADKAEAA